MSMVMRFAPQGMTAEKYDEVIKKLEAAGAGSPKGRLYHVCFGDKNNLRVSDVWDSMENFEAFGQILMPILQEQGIDPGQPDIIEVHNIIVGVV
jgi:hypothetical protein